MEDGTIPLDCRPCWVYVSEAKSGAGQLQVGYSRTLPGMLAGTGEHRLLYYRQFSTISDGLGHKLLLEELSTESLLLTIRVVNPAMNDLHTDFIMNHPKGH